MAELKVITEPIQTIRTILTLRGWIITAGLKLLPFCPGRTVCADIRSDIRKSTDIRDFCGYPSGHPSGYPHGQFDQGGKLTFIVCT